MSMSTDVLELARETGRDLAHRASERVDSADSEEAAHAARDAGTIDYAVQSAEVRRSADVVRAAASASFVKELAKICGKAGAAGAAVDGAVGGIRAAQYVQEGAIDRQQALKHVGAEAGCGFVTSSSGTAGTLAVFMVTGSMGPVALAAGMGASMGSRYLYKEAVGETLPDEEELEGAQRGEPEGPPGRSDGGEGADVEDIGPGAEPSRDGGADIEDIGPGAETSANGTDGTVGGGGDETKPPNVEEIRPQGSSKDTDGPSPEVDDSDDSDDGPNGGDVWESIGPDSG
jgi:hypothetical protein